MRRWTDWDILDIPRTNSSKSRGYQEEPDEGGRPPDASKRRSLTSWSIWWQYPPSTRTEFWIPLDHRSTHIHMQTSATFTLYVYSPSHTFIHPFIDRFPFLFLFYLPSVLHEDSKKTGLRYFERSSSSRDWMDLLLLSHLSTRFFFPSTTFYSCPVFVDTKAFLAPFPSKRGLHKFRAKFPATCQSQNLEPEVKAVPFASGWQLAVNQDHHRSCFSRPSCPASYPSCSRDFVCVIPPAFILPKPMDTHIQGWLEGDRKSEKDYVTEEREKENEIETRNETERIAHPLFAQADPLLCYFIQFLQLDMDENISWIEDVEPTRLLGYSWGWNGVGQLIRWKRRILLWSKDFWEIEEPMTIFLLTISWSWNKNYKRNKERDGNYYCWLLSSIKSTQAAVRNIASITLFMTINNIPYVLPIPTNISYILPLSLSFIPYSHFIWKRGAGGKQYSSPHPFSRVIFSPDHVKGPFFPSFKACQRSSRTFLTKWCL